MDKKIIDTLKKIEFFDDKLSDQDISNVSKNTYEIKVDNRSYLLKLYDNSHRNESESISKFDKFSKAITGEFLEELNQYYQIYDFDNFISLREYLDKSNEPDQYDMGYKFGKFLKEFHSIPTSVDIDWYKLCKTKSNYLFYMHGLCDIIGDNDYILVDYISNNQHLTKSVNTSYLISGISLDDIIIDDKLNILALDFKDVGDPIFDFTSINRIAIKNPEFSRGVINAYFDGKKAPIKFFRLLALYQAYLILENMVNARSSKPCLFSKEEEKLLLLMYDNYNQEIPQWIWESLWLSFLFSFTKLKFYDKLLL